MTNKGSHERPTLSRRMATVDSFLSTPGMSQRFTTGPLATTTAEHPLITTNRLPHDVYRCYSNGTDNQNNQQVPVVTPRFIKQQEIRTISGAIAVQQSPNSEATLSRILIDNPRQQNETTSVIVPRIATGSRKFSNLSSAPIKFHESPELQQRPINLSPACGPNRSPNHSRDRSNQGEGSAHGRKKQTQEDDENRQRCDFAITACTSKGSFMAESEGMPLVDTTARDKRDLMTAPDETAPIYHQANHVSSTVGATYEVPNSEAPTSARTRVGSAGTPPQVQAELLTPTGPRINALRSCENECDYYNRRQLLSSRSRYRNQPTTCRAFESTSVYAIDNSSHISPPFSHRLDDASEIYQPSSFQHTSYTPENEAWEASANSSDTNSPPYSVPHRAPNRGAHYTARRGARYIPHHVDSRRRWRRSISPESSNMSEDDSEHRSLSSRSDASSIRYAPTRSSKIHDASRRVRRRIRKPPEMLMTCSRKAKTIHCNDSENPTRDIPIPLESSLRTRQCRNHSSSSSRRCSTQCPLVGGHFIQTRSTAIQHRMKQVETLKESTSNSDNDDDLDDVYTILVAQTKTVCAATPLGPYIRRASSTVREYGTLYGARVSRLARKLVPRKLRRYILRHATIKTATNILLGSILLFVILAHYRVSPNVFTLCYSRKIFSCASRHSPFLQVLRLVTELETKLHSPDIHVGVIRDAVFNPSAALALQHPSGRQYEMSVVEPDPLQDSLDDIHNILTRSGTMAIPEKRSFTGYIATAFVRGISSAIVWLFYYICRVVTTITWIPLMLAALLLKFLWAVLSRAVVSAFQIIIIISLVLILLFFSLRGLLASFRGNTGDDKTKLLEGTAAALISPSHMLFQSITFVATLLQLDSTRLRISSLFQGSVAEKQQLSSKQA